MNFKRMVSGSAHLSWMVLRFLMVSLMAFWLIILTLSFLLSLSDSEIASWVQAVGAILAIWGAFRIGNMQHIRDLEQRKEEARNERALAKDVMARLAQGIDFNIGSLYEAVSEVSRERGPRKVRDYLISGADLRWPHQLSALQLMDIRILNGVDTMLLADLKTACSFAIRLCDSMADESSFMAKRQDYVVQLMFQRASVRAAYMVLSPPGWEVKAL